MSQTISPGLVGASHWTYVAAATAKALRERAYHPKSAEPIPAGVFHAAKEFFRMVIEAIDAEVPVNPVASAANYGIAVRALQGIARPEPKNEEEANELLREYAVILEELAPEHTVQVPRRREELLEVAQFFLRIAVDGETEAYERYGGMKKDASPIGL